MLSWKSTKLQWYLLQANRWLYIQNAVPRSNEKIVGTKCTIIKNVLEKKIGGWGKTHKWCILWHEVNFRRTSGLIMREEQLPHPSCYICTFICIWDLLLGDQKKKTKMAPPPPVFFWPIIRKFFNYVVQKNMTLLVVVIFSMLLANEHLQKK